MPGKDSKSNNEYIGYLLNGLRKNFLRKGP